MKMNQEKAQTRAKNKVFEDDVCTSVRMASIAHSYALLMKEKGKPPIDENLRSILIEDLILAKNNQDHFTDTCKTWVNLTDEDRISINSILCEVNNKFSNTATEFIDADCKISKTKLSGLRIRDKEHKYGIIETQDIETLLIKPILILEKSSRELVKIRKELSLFMKKRNVLFTTTRTHTRILDFNLLSLIYGKKPKLVLNNMTKNGSYTYAKYHSIKNNVVDKNEIIFLDKIEFNGDRYDLKGLRKGDILTFTKKEWVSKRQMYLWTLRCVVEQEIEGEFIIRVLNSGERFLSARKKILRQ